MTRILFLQVIPYSTSFDATYLYFLLGFVVLIVLVVYANKYTQSRKDGSKISKPGTVHATGVFLQTRNFRKEIREVAARCNLSDNQADFFMRLCARYRISNPLYLLRNEKILDELFSRAFHALQTGDTATKDAEVSKTILFTLREAIDNYRKLSTVIKSTRSVERGMELLLVTPQEEQYPTVVLENSARGLVCRLPRDEFGNEIRLPIWSKVDLFFSTDNGQSYRCTTRILRYESGTRETYGIIAHTDSLKPLPNRQHERMEINLSCRFRHVRVANVVSGKQTIHKFYPEGTDYPATICDISAGGCSLKTLYPPQVKDYIEIQCTLDGKSPDTMTGKVINLADSGGSSGTVVHIKFAKMPRATMNRIFSLTLNLGDR
jgi:hypothetical protein